MRLKETEAVRPDLDDRIARADIIARDAELDLARAMTKQASEQAELRVAQAALNAAQARLDRSQRDVQRLEQELASLAETAPLEAKRDAALAAQEKARTDRDQAGAAIAMDETSRVPTASGAIPKQPWHVPR